jgi:hypothetical protein
VKACGECIYWGVGAGMRDHGKCAALDGLRLPMWAADAMSDGHAIVAVNRCADSCNSYCVTARPIGAEKDWRTPYEKWLDEHKEG